MILRYIKYEKNKLSIDSFQEDELMASQFMDQPGPSGIQF